MRRAGLCCCGDRGRVGLAVCEECDCAIAYALRNVSGKMAALRCGGLRIALTSSHCLLTRLVSWGGELARLLAPLGVLTPAFHPHLTVTSKHREHHFRDLIMRHHQAPTMEVATTSELSSCALCNATLWIRGLEIPAEERQRRRDKWDALGASYDDLTASAAQSCEACTLLSAVFEPYASKTAESIRILYLLFHPHFPSVFGVLQGIWRVDNVRLFTTESRLLCDAKIAGTG